METFLRYLIFHISSPLRNVLWKIKNANSGISTTVAPPLNPNWIGDQFIIMYKNMKKNNDRVYMLECMKILDEAYENIDIIMDGKTKEEQDDIAGSLHSVLVYVHSELGVDVLKYSVDVIWNELKQKDYV